MSSSRHSGRRRTPTLLRRSPLLFLALVAALTTSACDDSPTQPNQPPLVFQGVLEAEGRSSHEFQPTKEGTVTITLEDLNPRLVEASIFFDPATAVVGLGIGRPDDEGECRITGQTTLGLGDRQLYGLNTRLYCVTLFDPGNFPDDSSFNYALRVELPD